MKTTRAALGIICYLGSIVAANWLTSRYGFVPVGFGLAATAGTYMAGLAFVARDLVQDLGGRLAVLAVLTSGGVVSWFASTPSLAVASAAAFAVSEVIDMAVYTPLRRHGYVRAALGSNIVGSVFDTFVFLSLARFPMTRTVVAGQLVGKFWITAVVVAGVVMARAVLRNRVRAEGA